MYEAQLTNQAVYPSLWLTSIRREIYVGKSSPKEHLIHYLFRQPNPLVYFENTVCTFAHPY